MGRNSLNQIQEVETGEDKRRDAKSAERRRVMICPWSSLNRVLKNKSPSLRFSASFASLRLLNAFSTTWIRLKAKGSSLKSECGRPRPQQRSASNRARLLRRLTPVHVVAPEDGRTPLRDQPTLDSRPEALAESMQSKLGRINAEAQRTQKDAEIYSLPSNHLTVTSANQFFPLRFSAFSASLRLSGLFHLH